MITRLMPKFKVLEPSNLTGLRNGHVLAQMPVAADITVKTVGEHKFIENGLFVGLNAEGKITNLDDATSKQVFVHFDEELSTILDAACYYATPVEESEETYIRAVAMYVGDTVVTDNYAGELTTAKYAKVVDGVATLQTAADESSLFIAKATTLPTGEAAVELMLYK